jgi:hypothetical protein
MEHFLTAGTRTGVPDLEGNRKNDLAQLLYTIYFVNWLQMSKG